MTTITLFLCGWVEIDVTNVRVCCFACNEHIMYDFQWNSAVDFPRVIEAQETDGGNIG